MSLWPVAACNPSALTLFSLRECEQALNAGLFPNKPSCANTAALWWMNAEHLFICSFSFLLSSFQLSLIWCNNCWNQSGFNAALKSWLISEKQPAKGLKQPEKQPPRVGRSGQLPQQSRVSAADLLISNAPQAHCSHFYQPEPSCSKDGDWTKTSTPAETWILQFLQSFSSALIVVCAVKVLFFRYGVILGRGKTAWVSLQAWS